MSAVPVPSEELAITGHGRAALIDVNAAEHRAFRQTLLDIYVPRYGPEWEESISRSGGRPGWMRAGGRP